MVDDVILPPPTGSKGKAVELTVHVAFVLELDKRVAARFAAVDVVDQADLKVHNTATYVVVVIVSTSLLTRKQADVCM